MSDDLAAGTDPKGPIYIGGLDRSGKTTMRAFLASHSNVAIPAVGSNMWPYFYRRYGDISEPENWHRCLDAMMSYKHVAFLEPDRSRIENEFALGPRTYARLFSLFLLHYAEQQEKPRWGAQTGLIERYADELVASYPGVKVIHMIRDPRDRYEASLARWPDGKGRAGGATARWTYSTRLGTRHQTKYPEAYLLVRFEDLVRQPEDTLRRVCDFIEEPWEPAMLTMPGAPEMRSRLGSDSDPGSPALSPDYIGLFRERIPASELAFIQLHAGRLMRRFGYGPVPVFHGPMDRWAFFARTWPDQAVRMLSWRTVETLQQRFPAHVRRAPGARMRVEPKTGATP